MTALQCISPQDAVALIQAEPEITLFDVRDLQSYQQDHLSGAMHLSEDRVPLWIGRLAKDAPVMIYCYHGNSSKTFAQMFVDFRFSRVYSVDGGYRPLASALTAPVADLGIPALQLFLGEWSFDPEDLDAPRLHGLTPLMRAALQGEARIVDELLAAGVDIHARNDDGNTALWLACVSRDTQIIEALIKAGIELDNRNDAGSTALMYTASSDRPQLLEILLKAGADPQVRNFDEMRAVELAASRACLKLLRHTAD